MVMKNRESRLKTSAIVVSSLLLYVCLSSLTSFSLVTVRSQSEVGFVSPTHQGQAINPKQSGHTLFNHSLIQRVNISRLDVFSSIFLECGKPISNAVWHKCRNKIRGFRQHAILVDCIQAVRE